MLGLFFIAQDTAGSGAGAPGVTGMGPQFQLMVFLILGLVVYWFLVLRPHNKKRKEMDKKLNNLSKGDKVVTIGGVHGKVVSTKDKLVVVRVDDRAEITFDKSAISSVEQAVSKNGKEGGSEGEVAAEVKENNGAEKEDEKK